jgi:hypothetical protein
MLIGDAAIQHLPPDRAGRSMPFEHGVRSNPGRRRNFPRKERSAMACKRGTQRYAACRAGLCAGVEVRDPELPHRQRDPSNCQDLLIKVS